MTVLLPVRTERKRGSAPTGCKGLCEAFKRTCSLILKGAEGRCSVSGPRIGTPKQGVSSDLGQAAESMAVGMFFNRWTTVRAPPIKASGHWRSVVRQRWEETRPSPALWSVGWRGLWRLPDPHFQAGKAWGWGGA